ncbi:adenosylcobinamide-GDP ribazoletransferase [Marinobacter nanhaiticus D15-8W]|uniref:adenosylcobinamide-GDP ribazoletransferase n=1 Tax=Marinobacter nanhaiticus TaxID=1305740 RepID=UPI0002CB3E7F|nr:adenosylcobinamide-GDP ribazoletransferase [Marinobacter nanhaiticus]BES71559.1 adenosylcobinamide-GDP ribazoletransferase [Marinobacter nanhaiticus D15-8W]
MSQGRSRLQQEWQTFWLAISFLTRIPIPIKIDYSQRLMNNCSMYFPLVGLLLGLIYASAFTLFQYTFTPLVSVLAVIMLHLSMTGAFHEDGLADSMDALGGGYTLEDKLRIMKDSRIGTYGTIALIMALALKTALLLDSDTLWLALLVAPCVSRLTPLLLMRALPYVTTSDTSKTKPVASGFPPDRLYFAVAFTAVVVVAAFDDQPELIVASLIATGGVGLIWGGYLKSRLGGYTGDTLGACVVLSELVLLAGMM